MAVFAPLFRYKRTVNMRRRQDPTLWAELFGSAVAIAQRRSKNTRASAGSPATVDTMRTHSRALTKSVSATRWSAAMNVESVPAAG